MHNKNINRARLFIPFDALKGYKEALQSMEKRFDNKIELFDDWKENLDFIITTLKKGDLVRIVHYCNLEYIDTYGYINSVDFINKRLLLKDTIIDFENIISIDALNTL